jgi:hypothetical protein
LFILELRVIKRIVAKFVKYWWILSITYLFS